jgi:hypothetical protein
VAKSRTKLGLQSCQYQTNADASSYQIPTVVSSDECHSPEAVPYYDGTKCHLSACKLYVDRPMLRCQLSHIGGMWQLNSGALTCCGTVPSRVMGHIVAVDRVLMCSHNTATCVTQRRENT